eukprot:s1625_g11.t1
MNPTGLRSKAKDLHSLPAGLYTVQETHLTANAIADFRKELVWQKTGYSITHGHPAPPRSQTLSSVGGRHTGVAVLSKFPCRQVQHHWTDAEFSTGRCLTASAFVQENWLTIGTVYGYNEHRQSLEVQQSTDSLLSRMTSRVLHGAQGMRIMTGDWNLERSQIPQADEWESKGWVEAQELALKLWNRPIQSTCKKTSVKDFVYLSPELVPYVLDVELNWTLFADHAVVIVHLADFRKPAKLPIWRKPSKLGWPKAPDNMQWPQRVQPHENMDVWYERIWKNAEAYAQQLQQQAKCPTTANMLGRATTKEVHWTVPQTTPVKPNRRGDVQSNLDTSSLQHSRWTKQIRRLQHLTRCLHSQSESPSLLEHRASLWHKVRTATGFPGGFCAWWAALPKQFVASPHVLPSQIPSSDLAQAVFTEFLVHYRQLETNLSQAKLDHAIQRRAADPNLIYKDIRREPAEPVQTLIMRTDLPISSVQNLEGGTVLHVTSSMPQGQDVVRVNEVPINAQLVDEQHIMVPDATVDATAQVSLEYLEGDPVKLLQCFSDEWAPRWNKPSHDHHEVWDAITSFMKAAVVPQQAQFPPITVEGFRKEAKRKKWTAAVGPDGVSKADLTHAPDAVIADLVTMFTAIEQGAPWPTQATTGMVSALAKVPNARTTSQFRPITIFSLYYRIWGSIRAKQCLRFLASLIPHTQLGNIPRRSSKQMWYHIQEIVEFSHALDFEAAGCVIDITKCFNALPRFPLLAIGAHIGLPSCVLTPWTTALSMFERRFQVRGYTGPAILSNCGFPEGDALSTVAMAICCMACELWVVHKNPRIQVWSYVDNIETLTADAEDACASKELLTEFCQLLDLEVDQSKSYCWSTTAKGRKKIREANCESKLFARDLGGRMSYGRLKANMTITQKIELLQPFWHRTARSCAPNTQKQRAILTAAWPNLFYGISTVTIGSCHFDKLRTLANKAIGCTQAGVAPSLQLSCLCPTKMDPEFYCLVHTVKSYRDCHSNDLSMLTMSATLEGSLTSQGPCASLLHCLHKIAWSWDCRNFCVDHNQDPVDIMLTPMQLLEERLQEAWHMRIFSTLETMRNTMQGLPGVDACLTRECLLSLPNDHQGLMRCALNGTQFANNALAHANVVANDTCKFCDQRDSQFHRHWSCPFFDDVRAQFPDLASMPNTEDPCLLNHGWIPRSEHWLLHQRNLDKLPDTTAEIVSCPVRDQLVYFDLFLDGSCVHPNDKYLRVASWAVVLWTGEAFAPISQGGVPGRRQTSLRGELTAAISALKFAARSAKPCRLWIDNQHVVDGIVTLLKDADADMTAKKDVDLWTTLKHQLRVSKHNVVQVFKVQAHVDVKLQETPLDACAAKGNHAADQAAEAARLHLPQVFWSRWALLRDDVTTWRRKGRQVFSMYVAIALKAQQAKTMPDTHVIPQGIVHEPEPEADAALLHLAQLHVDDLPAKYRVQAAEHVLRWIRNICQPDRPAIWVSFHQLLLHYQKYTNHVGPTCDGRRWVSQSPDQYEHRQQVQWIARYLQNLCKDTSQPLKVSQRRPPSFVLTFWSGHVAVCLSSNDLLDIDTFLQKHVDRLPARQIRRDMANVPPGWTT